MRRVMGGIAGAAGLALSPDGETLYVSDLGSRCIWAVDAAGRELTAGGKGCRLFVGDLPGYPTALAVDADGSVYVTYPLGRRPLAGGPGRRSRHPGHCGTAAPERPAQPVCRLPGRRPEFPPRRQPGGGLRRRCRCQRGAGPQRQPASICPGAEGGVCYFRL